MEMQRQKPIHLRCQKCGYDFSYNANYVERNIDTLKKEITQIVEQLTQFKAEHPDARERNANKWYQSAKKAQVIKTKELSELKNYRKIAEQEIKLQTYYAFRRKVAEIIGNDKMIELVRECEKEMAYHDYETAVQKHNNFENA